MVHFVSHCGVTNAVYYASQFPSAFPPLPALQGIEYSPVLLDLRSGTVPNNFRGTWDPAVRVGHVDEEAYGAVLRVQWGSGPSQFAGFFLHPDCLTRNFLVAAFPSEVYPTVRTIGTTGHWLNPWREPPTSRWYVYFGCPVCGEYQRKHGFTTIPLEPGLGAAYYIKPLELFRCTSCGANQRACNGTAPGLRLGE
jgi:hypothetical protein